jgi:hypothetical protein
MLALVCDVQDRDLPTLTVISGSRLRDFGNSFKIPNGCGRFPGMATGEVQRDWYQIIKNRYRLQSTVTYELSGSDFFLASSSVVMLSLKLAAEYSKTAVLEFILITKFFISQFYHLP